ncbi:MAG: 23S rRNA (adenine2503-C2)-methyltransferase, partial [bacterium]
MDKQTQVIEHIFGLTLGGLKTRIKEAGLPAFRAGQIMGWIYDKGILDPEEMPNISKKDALTLKEHICFDPLNLITEQVSKDGTVKWLFKLHDGHDIETVFIPEPNRGTLCVSSQVGCTLNCRFCHTGTQGLSRNLLRSEIVAQVWMAAKRLGQWSDNPFNLEEHIQKSGFDDEWMIQALGNAKKKEQGIEVKRIISNIVFMGMGEPLFNWPNVESANNVLMDEKGFGYGSRRITISTSGMVDNIGKIAKSLGVNLAISIHAPDNETRTKIMPVNKKWDVDELMAALHAFPLKEHRRITWEYVMLKDTNDTVKHAKMLVKLIEGIPSFVNIIPFNEWPGSPFERSTDQSIEAFRNTIASAGVDVNVRRGRGEDILAACGQLRGETSKFNSISAAFPSVVMQYGTEKQQAMLATNGPVTVKIVD